MRDEVVVAPSISLLLLHATGYSVRPSSLQMCLVTCEHRKVHDRSHSLSSSNLRGLPHVLRKELTTA